MSRNSIVISSGDPAGCGPIVTLKAIDQFQQRKINFFVVGDKVICERIPIYRKLRCRINLIDLNTPGIGRVKLGKPTKLSGEASLSYLDKALALMKKKQIKRLVTAPLSKEAVGLIKKGFSGHTEYLAEYFKAKKFAMMMVSSNLKVVLLTRHICLRDVPAFLQKKIFTICFV